LSGIRSGHGTHGDILHPTIYGEFKHTQRAAVLTLLREVRRLAQREHKMPLIVMHEKGTQNYATVLPLSDFETIWNVLREAGAALVAPRDQHASQLAKRIKQLTGGK
jgi:hypothetical protein